jgi:hypothetical protein
MEQYPHSATLTIIPLPLQFDIPAQHAGRACRRFLISILFRGPYICLGFVPFSRAIEASLAVS